MKKSWKKRVFEKYERPRSWLIVSMVGLFGLLLLMQTKIQFLTIIILILIVWVFHSIVNKQPYHFFNVIYLIPLVGVFLDFHFFANLNIFVLLSAILIGFSWFMLQLAKSLEIQIKKKYTHSLPKIVLLLWEAVVLLISLSMSLYFILFTLSTWVSVQAPKSVAAEILSLEIFRTLLIILVTHIIVLNFMIKFSIILHESIKKDKSKLTFTVLIITILIILVLPDLIYAVSYYITMDMKNLLIPKPKGWDVLVNFCKTFYFTFAIHYAMPILDGNTFSSKTLRLLSNNYELKFLQVGQIIISKGYDLMALAGIVDFVKKKIFISDDVVSDETKQS
ncbi:hypothetical protein [Paenibacillus sinopodophylli]|uniref:hypothetical protein n=1 Tax=Paenibacillus sinopodophylli TaxID=1837342 RepID=UPI00110CFB1C|nr:hypothetical protein [Paenibacillus sinopodophylli]